jgi:hypothetical protein
MRAVALVGGDTCVMRRRVAVTPRPLKIKSKILLPTSSPYFSLLSVLFLFLFLPGSRGCSGDQHTALSYLKRTFKSSVVVPPI